MHIRNYTIYTLATTLVKKPRLIHWTFLRAGLNYIVVYKKKIKKTQMNERMKKTHQVTLRKLV